MKKRGKPIIHVRELWKIYRMGEEEPAAGRKKWEAGL